MFSYMGFSVICAVLVILLTPLINWYLNILKNRSLNKVPGPKPIPIFGNTNLLGKTPTEYLTRLVDLQREYGPFFKLWFGSKLRVIVSKPEYLEKLLTSNTNVAKSTSYDYIKPWLGDGLLISTGLKWKQRRKMITPTFHFKILEDFVNVFNNQTNIMLSKVMKLVKESPGQTIDIVQFVNLMSLDIICETAFGTSIGAQQQGNPKYVAAVQCFLELFTERFFSAWKGHPLIFRFSDTYKTHVQVVDTLHTFSNNVIKKRREEFAQKEKTSGISDDGVKRRSALLDMLLEANWNNKDFTDEDIRDEVNTFMFEGHDTTSTAISFILYALAQHPTIQERAYEEACEVLGNDPTINITVSHINDLKYLDLVIKETLRVYPSVPLIERNIVEDWTVAGVTIPKNTTVTIFIYGMNHDPSIYPNPEKFDPDRFLPENSSGRHNYSYLPFSAGPRNCVGQKFAMYEMKACIAKFLLQFKVEEDPSFKIEVGTCSVLKSMNGCQMKIKPRNIN